MKRRVLVFLKEPLPGRVKTRLAKDVGKISAANWFRRRARRQIRMLAADARWDTWLAVSPDAAGMNSRFWPTGVRRWPQGGGDLGARMGRAFAQFPPGPLVIVGADSPDMTQRHIWKAFKALGQADAVYGPAEDGGYWLIGRRRAPRAKPAQLFEGVRWSTQYALADTLSSAPQDRVAMIDTLRDVDHAADLDGPIP